jgi:NAD(P)-dependent dehydrogenase (short-subunit alcohol dehydrogenase family)
MKIALVTGAGSGIGQAAAIGLYRAGFAVVLAGRRREALAATMRLASMDETRSLVIPTDVTDPAAVRNLFAQTKQVFGRLDVLFNNAGIGATAAFEDLPLEQWQAVIATNLTGPFLCAQEAFRLMKNQQPRGGRIINNGSLSAHVPRPGAAAYNAAKHGISGLTKSCALDGRAFDIACGQIDIGNADTAMAGKMRNGALQADGTTAVEPLIELRHVADAVVYMALLPLDVNVLNLTVMANRMPYVGRG